MEQIAIYVYFAAIAVLAFGWLWLLGIAFSVRWWSAVALLVFPPTALVFVPMHWARTARPVATMLVALLPLGWAFATLHAIDLGPYQKVVDGEKHLTLTGWNRQSYALLDTQRDVVVLQMANPDVTDETLKFLVGMDRLRELDLSHTEVSDDGLAILAQLPGLQILRLRDTDITDAGFRQHLMDKESLTDIDCYSTEKVLTKTLREWKNKKPGRRYLR